MHNVNGGLGEGGLEEGQSAKETEESSSLFCFKC